jgi:hypothetical protein
VKLFAQTLCRDLADAIDVPGNRDDILCYPGGRLAGVRRQRRSERARRAGEDESLYTGRHRRLKEGQRAGDVRINEILVRVGRDMGLMQCRRMDDRADVPHAAFDEVTVIDRADAIGERRRQDIDAKRRTPRLAQRPHQRLAKMTGTPGHENGHDRLRNDPPRRAEKRSAFRLLDLIAALPSSAARG